MGVFSGKHGVVGNANTVSEWSIEQNDESVPYVASNTLLGTGRVRGNSDFTGNWMAYGGQPALMPGAGATFQGFANPTNGISGNGPVYSGLVVVDAITVEWNWENAAIISHSVSFGGDGALTESSAGALTDSSFPTAPSPIGLPVLYSLADEPGSGFDELEDVVSASLNITSAVKEYVNSSTNGVVRRKSGPFDFKVQIVVHQNSLEALPFNKWDLVQLQLPTSNSEQWELAWCLYEGASNFKVNRSTGDIEQMTLNFSMCGFNHTSEEIGQIVMPDTTVWWPAS